MTISEGWDGKIESSFFPTMVWYPQISCPVFQSLVNKKLSYLNFSDESIKKIIIKVVAVLMTTVNLLLLIFCS